MSEEIKSPVRVGTRVSHSMNEWLDRRSQETAISKSTLINIALENYRKEVEVMDIMPDLKRKLKEQGIEI